MAGVLKYIVDDSGNKTSVLVPVKVWEDLNSNYEKLQAKLAILSGIRDGLMKLKGVKNPEKNYKLSKTS